MSKIIFFGETLIDLLARSAATAGASRVFLQYAGVATDCIVRTGEAKTALAFVALVPAIIHNRIP